MKYQMPAKALSLFFLKNLFLVISKSFLGFVKNAKEIGTLSTVKKKAGYAQPCLSILILHLKRYMLKQRPNSLQFMQRFSPPMETFAKYSSMQTTLNRQEPK